MTGLAKVNDVIEHGQTIPGNVVCLRDASGARWSHRLPDYRMARLKDSDTLPEWFPMTVVEVDPEPQPASAAILVVGDDIEWGQGIPAHVIRMVGGSLNGRPDSDPVDLCLITETGNGDVTWWSAGGDENWSGEDIPQECYPLRVTRVREPQPADSRCPHGYEPGDHHWHGCMGISPLREPDEREVADTHLMMVLGVDRLDGVIPAIEFLQADRKEKQRLTRVIAEVRRYAAEGLRDLDATAAILEITAPPREPRTWPKLDAAPDDLPTHIEVDNMRFRRCVGADSYVHEGTGGLWSWHMLLAQGEVREVLS